MQDLAISTSIIPATKTDHTAIFVEFGTTDNQMKSPGLWKMNCSILDDEDYTKDITLKIPNWIADGERELSDNGTIFGIASNITYAYTYPIFKTMRKRKKRTRDRSTI